MRCHQEVLYGERTVVFSIFKHFHVFICRMIFVARRNETTLQYSLLFFFQEGGQVLTGLGLGGQVAVADMRHGVSYAYITNHLPGLLFTDPAAAELRNELYFAINK